MSRKSLLIAVVLLAGFATACADATAPAGNQMQQQCTPSEGQGYTCH